MHRKDQQGEGSSGGKPSGTGGAVAHQIDALKSIAKMFRAAISRRGVPIKSISPTASISESEANIAAVTDEVAATPLETEKVPNGVENVAENEIVPSLINATISTLKAVNNGNSDSITDTPTATRNNLNNTANAMPIADLAKSIRAMDAVYSSIRDIYSVIRHGLRRYEITDSDCQSRIVCEIHQKVISRNKMLKTFSLNAIDVLR